MKKKILYGCAYRVISKSFIRNGVRRPIPVPDVRRGLGPLIINIYLNAYEYKIYIQIALPVSRTHFNKLQIKRNKKMKLAHLLFSRRFSGLERPVAKRLTRANPTSGIRRRVKAPNLLLVFIDPREVRPRDGRSINVRRRTCRGDQIVEDFLSRRVYASDCCRTADPKY